MMKNNLNSTDELKLFVKKEKLDDIVKHYKIFGWEVVKSEENKRYEDIIDVTFFRPHKINNKDDLQLLQVYMEDNLNKIAKLEKNKSPKTITAGLCLGVFGVLFVTLGILYCLSVLPVLSLAGGIPLICLGAILIVTGIIFVPKIYKKEKIIYEKKHNELNLNLQLITKEALKLKRGKA